MRQSWLAAPVWLRAACVLGVVWWVACMLVGVPLLVLPGPGLPVMALGVVGFLPWWFLLNGDGPSR